MRQQYLNDCVVAQNLILEISANSSLLEDQTIQQKISQLQECFSLPVTQESIEFFERKIMQLKEYVSTKVDDVKEEGRESGYTKVKKTGNAFVPVEELEKKNIEVPNYDVPIFSSRSSLRQEPDYIFHDKPVRVSQVPNTNRGSSHVFMLAFLTFFFETLFLLLTFLMYR